MKVRAEGFSGFTGLAKIKFCIKIKGHRGLTSVGESTRFKEVIVVLAN